MDYVSFLGHQETEEHEDSIEIIIQLDNEFSHNKDSFEGVHSAALTLNIPNDIDMIHNVSGDEFRSLKSLHEEKSSNNEIIAKNSNNKVFITYL